MTDQRDTTHDAGRLSAPMMKNPHGMQVDEETGLPVFIVPDGEKERSEDDIDPDEHLRIDPESRIPRPVQPDLA